MIDSSNHILHQIWFNNKVAQLNIEANIEVESHEFNPFNFLVDTHSAHAKSYDSEKYLEKSGQYSSDFLKMVSEAQLSTDGTIGLVNGLLSAISDNWKHEERFEENIHDPSECFQLKNGSCRDLSWMMIHMLRVAGIPSRFISGYAFNPDLGEGHELHAWIEFFIKGAGWIGVDPSAGIYTTHQYIPVSSDPDPRNTLPVNGKFRGKGHSTLTTRVRMSRIKK